MSALDVLRQIKQLRRANQGGNARVVEWGNADYINSIGIENLTRRELRNHLEARDLDTGGTRLELLERLRASIADEQLHKFAYAETLDTEQLIQADLEERGSVYVTGANERGQLGMGDLDNRRFFTPIPSLRGVGVVNVSCGTDMAFAVTQEHDLYVWGGGGSGRTGINPNARKKGFALKPKNWLEPALVSDMTGEECKDVAVGSSHCLALGRGGDCFVWGDNEAGQLGLGNFDNRMVITVNNSFPACKQVAAGANHSAILTVDDQIYIWGHGANGRLGTGESERVGADDRHKHFFPLPSIIRSVESVQQISCGSDYTLAVGSTGAWAWGSGSSGKLGLGDQHDRYEPVQIPKLKGRSVLQVVATTWFSMALVQFPPILQGGILYTWGSGYFGQLAQGSKCLILEPEVVDYFMHVHLMVKLIAGGPHHCLAVTTDGELYSWGNNALGALGRKIPEKDVTYTPVPGHVPGFGALVNLVGRGYPRAISCGRDFSVVCTYPYEGPDFNVATRLMEEAKIKEQEANMSSSKRADEGTWA